MAHEEGSCAGTAVTMAFIGGAVLGVVAGILLAPQAGDRTRTAIRGYARRTEEDILEKAREIRSDMKDTIEEGKRFLNETKTTIASAFEAGKEAFKKGLANKS